MPGGSGLAAYYRRTEVREQNNKYANHPRENVNCYQAVAFTHWLTGKVSGSRAAGMMTVKSGLPTEQEWEAAARYPDGRQVPVWAMIMFPDMPTSMNVSDTGDRSLFSKSDDCCRSSPDKGRQPYAQFV